MANIISNPIQPIWYLAYNQSDDIWHYGEVQSNQTMTTHQPILEQFETEELLEARVDSFKGDGWYATENSITEYPI